MHVIYRAYFRLVDLSGLINPWTRMRSTVLRVRPSSFLEADFLFLGFVLFPQFTIQQ